jgi:four helix bundle protein
MAETSLEEVKYYFILAKDLGYIQDNTILLADAETVSRMLYRLRESVDSRR